MAKLASRYALALFQLAKEKNSLDSFYGQVKAMKEIMCSDEEIREFINNPKLSSEDKFKLFEGVFKGKAEPELLGFLSVIFNKNREKELDLIFRAFLEEVLEEKGIANAYVESAVPLKASQLEEIKTKLSRNLNKQIIIETKVSPELIGGVKITACGYVIDGTVRKGLNELKSRLLENRFA
ncbi:MAG: ATP synthase F1 subunit delta [Clostridiales bacterium]|nr:ATP synthase F1 subunit delta [Clostridiales bacterium]